MDHHQMASDSKKSLLPVCYLLMASLFALSTCFQFNDPDWYFWIPLYATACIVNLVKWVKPRSRIRKMAKFGFWLGLLLFIKVAIEGFVRGTDHHGFWSLDMRERIGREKFGSGLVIISMFLLLENSSGSDPNHPTRLTKYGMPILVAIACGLSFGFFVFQHDEMRF